MRDVMSLFYYNIVCRLFLMYYYNMMMCCYLTAGGFIRVVSPFPLLTAEGSPRYGGVGRVQRRVMRQVEVVIRIVRGTIGVVIVSSVHWTCHCNQIYNINNVFEAAMFDITFNNVRHEWPIKFTLLLFRALIKFILSLTWFNIFKFVYLWPFPLGSEMVIKFYIYIYIYDKLSSKKMNC